MLQRETSDVRGVVTPIYFRRCQDGVGFSVIFLICVALEKNLMILGAVETGSGFWTLHRCLVGPKCAGNALRIEDKLCAWG